jgi:SAM-dependent methyltransferase
VHPSQYEHMKAALKEFRPAGRHLDVLELGSATSPGQTRTHRSLFDPIDDSYVGVDISDGPTVDIVMEQPYTIPAASNSKDVIICGSVLEHVPFLWASMLEMARVLRPGGRLFVTVPSRGHKHSPIDCWRVYPDGLRALATWSSLTLLESHTHYPPFTEDKRHDYKRIDTKNHYWGDSVGVFEKPADYPLEAQLMQRAVRRWANKLSVDGPLGTTPGPRRACGVLPSPPAPATEAAPTAAPASAQAGTQPDRAPTAPDAAVRDRILAAAAAEFKSSGGSGVRLDRVAFRAGLPDKETIFETFTDQDELLHAAVAAGHLDQADLEQADLAQAPN